MTKKEIRKQMLQIRENIPEPEKKIKNKKITQLFIRFLQEKKVSSVLLYASFGSEVETWQIFKYCVEHSIKTAYPKVNREKKELELYWVNSFDELKPGYKSILEPTFCKRASIQDIGIIAVPGVAFDEQCFRVGYGGGFYDKLLLQKKGLSIGLAFEEQIVECLPKESHDQKVDLIITDRRVINCV